MEKEGKKEQKTTGEKNKSIFLVQNTSDFSNLSSKFPLYYLFQIFSVLLLLETKCVQKSQENWAVAFSTIPTFLSFLLSLLHLYD
jgi:hypothetical protein